MLTHKRKKAGQALVEFALSITLIFLLLSAIIDLGLAFFAYQGISGAAQEGAAYGALFPQVGNTFNTAGIRDRARYEAGSDQTLAHRARFVNLLDLDNDKIETDTADEQARIVVAVVQNTANPNNVIPCAGDAATPKFCDVRVRVEYVYKPFFSAASLLGASQITIHATRQMTIAR